MSGASQAIKNRINSVGNTKKITKAMQLVAATKMRKAVDSSLSSRMYAQHAWELLHNLSKQRNLQHPLLKSPDSKKILLVVIASNRGLCGSYNANVIKTAMQFIKQHPQKKVDLIVVGRKAELISRKLNNQIIASFVDLSDDIQTEELLPLSNLIIDEFIQDKYSQVKIAYTKFISSIKYEPKIIPLLPINAQDYQNFMTTDSSKDKEKKSRAIVTFEPSQEKVLHMVLPRLTEVQIYQSILEANASEHSARMVAMKNATENAENMIQDLTLYYNQARQAAITQEIAEISSGAESLSNH